MSKLVERLLIATCILVMVWITWNLYDRTVGTILTLSAQLQACQSQARPAVGTPK